jgi:hypothetical protein
MRGRAKGSGAQLCEGSMAGREGAGWRRSAGRSAGVQAAGRRIGWRGKAQIDAPTHCQRPRCRWQRKASPWPGPSAYKDNAHRAPVADGGLRLQHLGVKVELFALRLGLFLRVLVLLYHCA